MQTISVTRNGSDSMTLTNTSVRGFLVNFALGSGTLATTTLQNCVITAQLNRDGENGETILSAGMDVIPYVTKVATSENGDRLSSTVFGFYVPLSQVINLVGNDRLNVRLQSGACFQTSAPAEIDYTCTLTTLGGVGIENYTPTLKVYQVPSGQTTFSQSFGDFCSHIALIQPLSKITQIQLESRYYNDLFIKEDLQAFQQAQYPYSTQSSNLLAPKNGNVLIYGDRLDNMSNFPLMGVRISGTIDSNVSGNVYIAVWSGTTNMTVKTRAVRLKQRIISETSETMPSIV